MLGTSSTNNLVRDLPMILDLGKSEHMHTCNAGVTVVTCLWNPTDFLEISSSCSAALNTSKKKKKKKKNRLQSFMVLRTQVVQGAHLMVVASFVGRRNSNTVFTFWSCIFCLLFFNYSNQSYE